MDFYRTLLTLCIEMIRPKAASLGSVLAGFNYEMKCAGPAFMVLAHGLEINFLVILKQLKSVSGGKFQGERVT